MNCHWDLFLSPDPSTAWSWWEVRDCQPTVFKSLQSCEKNMLGEAREGWKGWEQKGQESLGDRKGVKVDICVLQFVRAEYKFTEFLEVNVKTGRRFLLALTQNTAVLGVVLHSGKLVSGAREQCAAPPPRFNSWSCTGGRGYWLKGRCPACMSRHHFVYLGYLWT